MKMILPAMLIASVCFAQKPYDFREAELKTRKLVYTNPDSALVVIKRTLAQKGDIHDTVYGNTYALYGLYSTMTGKPDSSIYYYKKSLPYITDFPRNKARSLHNMAVAYRNKGEYHTSIKQLEDVVELHKSISNDVGVAMAYGELASNYNLMQEFDKSIGYLQKAIAILKAKKNTQQLVAVKQKLANIYLRTENFKFAVDLYKECLPEFLAMGSDKNYYLTKTNLGEAYIQLKQYGNAKSALTEAVAGLEKFGDREFLGITYAKIGNLERIQGSKAKALKNYDKAMQYLLATKTPTVVRIGAEYIDLLNELKEYKKAVELIAAVEATNKVAGAASMDRLVFQKAAAATYSATNNDKKAIEGFKSTIAIMDSIAITDKNRTIQEMQAKFQTELQREKNLALEANNKALRDRAATEQWLMLLYIAGSIVLIGMILLFLRAYYLKNKLQQTQLKSVEAEKSLIQQQHLYEQELTNAQKEVIEEKQRQLTSKALQMANYQDSLNQIIEKCDSNIYTKVNDIKKDLLQLSKSKDYWKQFETRFNHLHPDFNTNLAGRFSKLTKNDIEFCSLLKLNLSNKEIASLLQISHESAITKKYRIKKKMEINDDQEFERVLLEL